MKIFHIGVQVALMLLPWSIRRVALKILMGYDIHPRARIGRSIIISRKLIMNEESRIGDLTFASGLERITMEAYSKIGKLNWISGLRLGHPRYFKDFPERRSELHLEQHAIIVGRNLIDCTDKVTIGQFALIAGNRGQILTHAIDLRTANQSCAPVTVGKYCMVGTGCILLKGAKLPDFSVLGAGSVLHKNYTKGHKLYSGVPAAPVKDMDPELTFFARTKGTSD
jgi:hypothetical protein